MAYQVLKAGQDLSMETVLRKLRELRHGAVQTREQYVYMHRVLVDLAVDKKLVSKKKADKFDQLYAEFMNKFMESGGR